MFWDAGFEFTDGDIANGYRAHSETDNFREGIEWLYKRIALGNRPEHDYGWVGGWTG